MRKKRNHYDEFLHKIQQPKMKELCDNKEDEDGKMLSFGDIILIERLKI